MKKLQAIIISLLVITLSSCVQKQEQDRPAGKLFIIGGGDRTDAMMNELIDLAGVRNTGYIFILPMASSVPDSSVMWAKEDFDITGVKNIVSYNFLKGVNPPQSKVDSLRNAKLIFICGGDQARFMSAIINTPVYDAIHQAYKNGAVISGTSAGAAVMSKKMITGNQKNHPEDESGYKTIESDNMEITQGLGMLTDVIIDQHFIKRQRLNRLVSVSIENPDELCVGIDESTAIIVDGDHAAVTGKNQVVVIKNTRHIKNIKDGLLGTEGLQLGVYLSGQQFSLR